MTLDNPPAVRAGLLRPVVRRGLVRRAPSAGTPPEPSAPVITSAPTLSPTSGDFGTVYTITPGAVTGYPTPVNTYAWYFNDVLIEGETGLTYTSVVGDVGTDSLHAVQTATNSEGSDTAATNDATVLATEPDAWDSGNWSVATGTASMSVVFTLGTEPAANGSAITGAKWRKITPLPAGDWTAFTSYTGPGDYEVAMAVAETAHTFRILAVNEIGDGAQSGIKGATSAAEGDVTPPEISAFDASGAPTVLSLTVDEEGTAKWQVDGTASYADAAAMDAATGSADATGTFAVTAGENDESPDLTGLTSGTYYLHIYVQDAAGNKSDVSSQEITVDNTAPTVASYSPADNATDVAVDAPIVITFDKAMDPDATAEVVLAEVGGAPVEIFDPAAEGTWSTVTYANDRWTVQPTDDFVAGAALAIQHSGFADTFGNAVAANTGDTLLNFATAAASGTDIMAGIGDFASATGWTLTADMTITGGVLDIATTSGFRDAARLSGNRVACPEAVTLSLEFNMVALTTATRTRVIVRPYNSGGTSLASDTTVFDTNTDGSITAGINSKADCYTTPADTATLAVTINVVTSGFVGQMDDFKLTYP